MPRKSLVDTPTTEDFGRWLNGLPSGERIGVAGQECNCPFWHYLVALGWDQYSNSKNTLAVGTDVWTFDGWRTAHTLPDEVQMFIAGLDARFPIGHSITAEIAREVWKEMKEK